MRQETRTIRRDPALGVEVCRLEGLAQPFPKHFHEHYVIGLLEGGARRMLCGAQVWDLTPGDVLLLAPGDSHACTQTDGGVLSYRAFHIPAPVMAAWAEAAGCPAPPVFSRPVVRDGTLSGALCALHQSLLEGSAGQQAGPVPPALSLLLCRYGRSSPQPSPACPREVALACAYLEEHCRERVTLDQLCHHVGLSKSTLLRSFARAKGLTPYRYLETLRINEARRLLAQGVPPAEAAVQTGFSDQSHFSNFFRSFLGLAPGLYRASFLGCASTEGGARLEK